MATEAACPDEHRILAFVRGEEIADLEAHIDACVACRALVSELARTSLIDVPATPTSARTEPASAPAEAALPRGTEVGRFVVERMLGAGGMGVVYVARDPALGRKVALKLLRAAAGSDASEGHARLLREAQAMARLSHPEVIGVYEVGTYEGRVFVAMEYVDGGTLSDWLRSKRRPWREVLELFIRAGRGLQAAHAAGLVHRDFKPDNVLRGRDGRVRVTDFGLARVRESMHHSSGERPAVSSGERPAVSSGERPAIVPGDGVETLTRTGTLLGTPAYMAPEQHATGHADALSDQFSFCVALYEGLYGERPFGGRSLDDLRQAVLDGRISEAPADSAVPAWVRRILLVGLAPDPAARHRSMVALLRALEHDPRAARRRILGAVAVVALAGAGAIAAYQHGTGSEARLCRGAEERWRGVWDADRREAIHRAFLASGRTFAESAWLGVAESLDEYTAAWAAMRTEACEATRVRGEHPESVLALRMACLDRSHTEVSSLTSAFAGADAEVVEDAVAATRSLPDLRRCADTAGLLAEGSLPGDPVARDRVVEVRRRLDATSALSRARRFRDALPQANLLLIAALATGHRPLEAEAYFLLGDLTFASGDYDRSLGCYENAALAAEAGGADRLAARAWIELFHLQATRGTDKELAERTNRLATAAMERAGRDDDLTVRHIEALGERAHNSRDLPKALAHAQAMLSIVSRSEGPEGLKTANALLSMAHAYHEMGKLELAEQAFQRALAIREKRLGADHPNVGVVVAALATLYGTQGRYDEAIASFRRALKIEEEALGLNHPSLATTLTNMSFTLLEQENYAEAQAVSERAAKLLEASYGPDHPRVSVALGALGNVHAAKGEVEIARRYFDRALAIAEATLGPDHSTVANLLTALAGLDQLEGKDADGVARFERALAIFGKTFGWEHINVAVTLSNLATLHLVSGRGAQALEGFRKALVIDERLFGPEHPGVAYDLSGIGRSYLLLGRAKDALPVLERALALREKAGIGTAETAETQFGLAQALWRTGGDRKRARKLAESAAKLYQADADPENATLAKDVRAWLRAPK